MAVKKCWDVILLKYLIKFKTKIQGGMTKLDTQIKYNEPWIMQRADPFICRQGNGKYYFTASVPAYDRIVLRRADTLAGIADAEEVTIWQKHASGIMSEHIWAPEVHYIDGMW